jgi:hypothetical protein
MILTPEGRFETNPNDYIMAMQDPVSLAQSGQERDNSETSSIVELVKAMVSSIHIATGMIVNAIHGIVFGTNNQYNIINNADNRADNRAYNSREDNLADNRAYNSNVDNRTYRENADNRADNRAYSSNADNRAYSENNADNRADNRAYNSTSTTNAYSYGGNESTIYNTFSENGGLMGMLAQLRDPLLEMVDMLAGFIMAQRPQTAYAGASEPAMTRVIGQTSNYAYTTMGGSSTVNAKNTFNVNVPPGTPQEQSEAIARQVGAQFDAKLADSINSSRANIPSPEVRRR